MEDLEQRVANANLVAQKKDNFIAQKLDKSVEEYYDNSIKSKVGQIEELTEKLISAEIEVKSKQIEGKKEVVKAEIETEVTRAKSVEDTEKHERAKTILKAQGLTEKLPKPFRITALVVGYPFFVLYLLSLGWVIEFITFIVKGFITMIFDCADKYSTLNTKFIENSNNKDFRFGKAIFNILKWLIIVSAIVVIIVLLMRN